MDLSNIVSTTENLLYQLAAWLVLLPKTLYRVVTSPTWIPDYVSRELAKPDEPRFDDYVPPLLFFVTLTVVPNLLANTYWPEIRYTDFATSREFIQQAQTLSAEHRFFVYTLIWMFLPLSFALVQLFARKKKLSGSELKPLLYTQCLRIAPLGPLFAIRFFIEKTLGDGAYLDVLNYGTLIIAFAWLLYSDVRISMHALKVTLGRAVTLALLSVVVYYAFIGPLLLLSRSLRG